MTASGALLVNTTSIREIGYNAGILVEPKLTGFHASR
jgi:hypothetical protein